MIDGAGIFPFTLAPFHHQEADKVYDTPHKSHCYDNEEVVDMQFSHTVESAGHVSVDSFLLQVCHPFVSDKNDHLKAKTDCWQSRCQIFCSRYLHENNA